MNINAVAHFNLEEFASGDQYHQCCALALDKNPAQRVIESPFNRYWFTEIIS